MVEVLEDWIENKRETKGSGSFPTFAMNNDYGCDEPRIKNPHQPHLRFCAFFFFPFFFVWLEYQILTLHVLSSFCPSARFRVQPIGLVHDSLAIKFNPVRNTYFSCMESDLPELKSHTTSKEN